MMWLELCLFVFAFVAIGTVVVVAAIALAFVVLRSLCLLIEWVVDR